MDRMIHNLNAATVRVAALLSAVSLLACSSDGVAKQHLARADTLIVQQNYPQAIQESRQALQAHQNDARATYLLARAHLELAELTQAHHYLLKARDLEPNDVDPRLDLAALYVIEAKPDEARTQADAALRRDSSNVTALIILGASSTTTTQADDAIRRLQRASGKASDDTRRRVALSLLYFFRKGDTATAGRLLREAVSADPNSAEAHAALASFYAEQHNPAAEREQKAADAIASNPRRRFELARFYLLLGQRPQAKRLLADIVAQNASDLPPRRLLAELRLVDGDQETLQTLEPILRRDSADVEALVQRGRSRLATHDVAGATNDFQRALRVAPDLAPIHYAMATANIERAGGLKQKPQLDSTISAAKVELEKAVDITKNYPDAVFQLAEVNIRLGNSRSAIKDMERFVNENPGSIRGYELLAAALSAAGRSDEAVETFQRLVKAAPDRPQSYYELGTALLGQGKKSEAAQQFETAVKLAPAYAEPMSQLVLMDLTSERSTSAINRVNEQLRLVPRSAPLHDLLGLVQAARNKPDSAEAAYREAVTLDPNLVDARVRLAELYEASGRPELALPHAESASRLEPANPRALMAAAVAYQQLNDVARARAAYEATLAISPQYPGAANNLAYLLSEQPGQEENAFKLASSAQRIAPDDPHVLDTLGWILYKRGDYQRALTVLKQSAAKLPESPGVQYHLGMAAQKMGDTTMARTALTKAVGASTEFTGKEEARKALAQLK
jgi:tetratricopeptide (TPR) repeat protein